jgi:hypothetical protein
VSQAGGGALLVDVRQLTALERECDVLAVSRDALFREAGQVHPGGFE